MAIFSASNVNDSGIGSLRQAIDDANLSPGTDTIDLSAVSGTIQLTSGEYLITDVVKIEGPGPELLTIDAQQQSRIFNFEMTVGDNSIQGVTLVNGQTTLPDASGGAVYSQAFGELTISNSVIRGSRTTGTESRGGAAFSIKSIQLIDSVIEDNYTTGEGADGGGIVGWFGDLQIIRSTISGNTTSGDDAEGGGALARLTATVIDSLIEGNRTFGYSANGGGVYSATVELANSMVRDNRTEGDHAPGGGIHARVASAVTNSTISENSTQGDNSFGGGFYFDNTLSLTNSYIENNFTEGQFASGGGINGSDLVEIIRSTISGNETRGDDASGGGIRFTGNMMLVDSLVSNNRTMGDRSWGGGIRADNVVTIENSTISGNMTLGDESGGGGFRASGDISILDSVISNNSTAGFQSYGGGIFSINALTIVNSTIIDNSTLGNESGGGGILANSDMSFNGSVLTMENSTISGNSTFGNKSGGGGILANGVTSIRDSIVSNNSTASYQGFGGGLLAHGATELNRTTVSGNTTSGAVSSGGGIHAIAPLTLIDTTVSGNSTQNNNSAGGGIVAFDTVMLQQSTLSGNWTAGSNSVGGGIAAVAPITLRQSTITENYTSTSNSQGGGIWSENEAVRLFGSILAENRAIIGPDLAPIVGTLYADYSLIEQANLPVIVGNNNLIGVEAELQPLADNGGVVMTYALLLTSPAINAGDPNFADPTPYDQRGFAFARVVDGRIDMGAFEAGAVSADFNGNGRVGGGDFLVWQRNFTGGSTHAEGDADIDQDVDSFDLAIWEDQFGLVAPESIVELSSAHGRSLIALESRGAAEGSYIHQFDMAMALVIDSSTIATILAASPGSDARDRVFSSLEFQAMSNHGEIKTVGDLTTHPDIADDLALVSRYTDQRETDIWDETDDEMNAHSISLAHVFEREVSWRRLADIGLLIAIMLIPLQSVASVTPVDPAPIIPADGGSRDLFGNSLSLEGETLIVGSPYHHQTGITRGAAYIYQFSSEQWQLQQELQSPIGEGISTFGNAVGVSDSTIVVGDPSVNFRGSEQNLRSAGTAYVFEQTPSGWNDVAQLMPDDPSVDAGFGGSVAVSGTTVLIGAAGNGGAAYVFEDVSGDWQQQAMLTPSITDGFGLSGNFGQKVLIQETIALVSASTQDAGKLNSGAVFAFEKGDQGWRETDMLIPSDPVFRGNFGSDIDISGDFAIVGRPAGGPAAEGPFQGAAYIFERQSGNWVEVAKLVASDGFLEDGFGLSVAISGNFAAVTAQHFAQGRIYLFEKTGVDWQEIGQILREVPFSTDQFGGNLALHKGKLVMGARLFEEAGINAGAVFVITIPEPSALLLAAMGLLGIAFCAQRRKKRDSA